jgi:hypothetical protein
MGIRLFYALETFKYKSLVTGQEATIFKGQIFTAEDPETLPVPGELGLHWLTWAEVGIGRIR